MITIKLKTEEERLAMRAALNSGVHGLRARETATRKEKTLKKLSTERLILLNWLREVEEVDKK